MQLDPNPWGAALLVAAVFAWTMAAIVYFARPGRALNRSLALLLFLEGGIFFTGLVAMARDRATAFAAAVTFNAMFAAFLPAYYIFFGTLDAPIARPFSRPAVRAALVAVALAGAAWVVAFPRSIIDVAPSVWPQIAWMTVPSPLYDRVLTPLALITYGFGLVVSISAFRATRPDTPARARAKAYVRAFLVYDLGWLGFLAWYLGYGRAHIDAPSTLWMASVYPATIDIVWIGLLAIGILRTQLFGLDVRIKWTLRRGTVAAIFVAVFFVVAQLAQAYLSLSLGLAVGAVATGLLLFALRPLERFADRVADRAMPNVHDPRSGDAARRRETYRAAVELALADGVVTRDEERALARLATLCGLSYEEADALRTEVERDRATAAPV